MDRASEAGGGGHRVPHVPRMGNPGGEEREESKGSRRAAEASRVGEKRSWTRGRSSVSSRQDQHRDPSSGQHSTNPEGQSGESSRGHASLNWTPSMKCLDEADPSRHQRALSWAGGRGGRGGPGEWPRQAGHFEGRKRPKLTVAMGARSVRNESPRIVHVKYVSYRV